ncbi:terminase large subunit domain-containing protein [Lysinibacillus xylanilyticus]|uniref:terminase large subunit domain-containing protein n=1 Tax=Lysinibacillus xylanilyticus TaxID=582475 RepID=UPI0038304BB2
MISYKYVDDYIQQWRDGKIILNKRRVKLMELIEREIYSADDMYFDARQIESYIAFTEKYYFPLALAQKFKTCFIFLYYDDGSLVFNEYLDYEGRGGGKTGRISSLANYFISDLHDIPYYNVSVVANSEKQAKMSFTEVYNKIDQDDSLKQYFDHKKALIESYDTKSVFQYHTSNANTKDGLRDGCVIFEEIHQYEDASTVNVFTSGLGKVKNQRIFYVGSDGYVRDGFMDKLNERADNILDGYVSFQDDGLFPFMCCLDDEAEMHDPNMWQKANSQFHPPLSEYAKTLFKTVMQQYKKLEHDPSGYEEFVTKRMNLPKVDLEKSVTSWEKILCTNQGYDLAELKRRECIESVDYAAIRDFVACGLLFKKNDSYIIPKELSHSFVCKPFADKHYAYSKKGWRN